jgi:hypothetical protein
LFGDPAPSTSSQAADLPPVPEDAEPKRPIRDTAERVPRQLTQQLNMLASYADVSIPTLVQDEPDEEGWREEYGRPLPRIVGGRCEFETERIRPDGTVAPCPRFSCRLHMGIHVNERTGEMVLNEGPMHRLGRPPALLESDERGGEKEVAFLRRALRQLAKLRFSCTLDAQRHYRALGRDPTEAEVGDHLGVSDETARLEFVEVQAKWRVLAMEGGYAAVKLAEAVGAHAIFALAEMAPVVLLVIAHWNNMAEPACDAAVEAMRRAQLAREAPRHPPLVQIRKRPR